jgi:hypothetical protein
MAPPAFVETHRRRRFLSVLSTLDHRDDDEKHRAATLDRRPGSVAIRAEVAAMIVRGRWARPDARAMARDPSGLRSALSSSARTG